MGEGLFLTSNQRVHSSNGDNGDVLIVTALIKYVFTNDGTKVKVKNKLHSLNPPSSSG